MIRKILELAGWVACILAIATFINLVVARPAAAWPWDRNLPIPEAKPKCEVCKTSDKGIALIQTFEGFSPFIYLDAAGLPTIGTGHLVLPGEKFKEPLLGADAEALLRSDLSKTERAVNRLVTPPLFQNQFDAVTSLTFNIGAGALQKSTLRKYVNADEHDLVPAQFLRWNKAGGRVVRGLTYRREAEALLYAE